MVNICARNIFKIANIGGKKGYLELSNSHSQPLSHGPHELHRPLHNGALSTRSKNGDQKEGNRKREEEGKTQGTNFDSFLLATKLKRYQKAMLNSEFQVGYEFFCSSQNAKMLFKYKNGLESK